MARVWGRRSSPRVFEEVLSGACAGGYDVVVIGAVGARMRVEKNALHGTPHQAAPTSFQVPTQPLVSSPLLHCCR
jgi:hypothetical protein